MFILSQMEQLRFHKKINIKSPNKNRKRELSIQSESFFLSMYLYITFFVSNRFRLSSTDWSTVCACVCEYKLAIKWSMKFFPFFFVFLFSCKCITDSLSESNNRCPQCTHFVDQFFPNYLCKFSIAIFFPLWFSVLKFKIFTSSKWISSEI